MVALGVVLAAMNACFFEAIDRIPLGVASTIEFTGPLLVAVLGSRRPRDVGFALLAGLGVALLGSPSANVDTLGALFAFGSAACWATYILLAKRLVGGAEPLPVLDVHARDRRPRARPRRRSRPPGRRCGTGT